VFGLSLSILKKEVIYEIKDFLIFKSVILKEKKSIRIWVDYSRRMEQLIISYIQKKKQKKRDNYRKGNTTNNN
jgi:hypothetical protein